MWDISYYTLGGVLDVKMKVWSLKMIYILNFWTGVVSTKLYINWAILKANITKRR